MSDTKAPKYDELQANLVKSLTKNHEYNKGTNVVVFDSEKLEMPEGITGESMEAHVNFMNQVSGAVEVATAEITRNLYAENDKINNVEGTLTIPGVTFNSEHILRSEVGDESLYGASTTMTDFIHTQEASDWLAEQRATNETLASKLFK
ncbi:phage protein [Vibrio phage pTD1]|uniref:Phage protein n=1 Tax=Vibrio phage pTD1 TaxID=1938577 RepID=A0A1Q2U357_9CAUD|nr:phage protein [Vibrio phage pTD1]BAW98394.1 phage protein [Vibrio phage pTD1]